MRRMLTQIVEVSGIVEDKTGHILLVKTQHDDWVLPGEQVEDGENLMDVLIRGIKEKSGIDVVISYLIGVYSNIGTHKTHCNVAGVSTKFVFDFMCKPVGEDLRSSEETSLSLWFEKDRVLEMVTAPDMHSRYQAYMNFDGSSFYMDYVLTKS